MSEVCEACFAPDVQESIYLCASNRFDMVLGKATYGRAGDLRRRIGKKNADGIVEADSDRVLAIIINNNIFWHINNQGKAEIIVHETCHIIDFYLQLIEHGRIKAEHGERWRRMMWACGFNDREYIPHSDLGIPEYYALSCNTCSCKVNTSRAKHSRVKSGSLELYCRDCSTKLVADDLPDFILDKRASA